MAFLAWDAPPVRAAPAVYDAPAPLPPPVYYERPVAETASPSPPMVPARPKLNLAVGMGASFESSGFAPARTEMVPAFFATGGVGDAWPLGFELGAFASSASGRFRAPDAPVDRLSLDARGVLRPLTFRVSPEDRRYRARLVRAMGLELGLGIERDGTTVRAGSRLGVHTGVRLEVPLTPAGAGSELRLRLGVRRMIGLYTPRVGTVDVGDSLDVFAALVTVF
jgi:hypothetical protein